MDYLLGVDAGTSVVKASLFDFQGREHVTALRRTALSTPQRGWSETSPQGTWDAFVATIREVLREGGVGGSRIAAVGVTGNMIGAWLVDAQGQPVRDAILWNDSRSGPLIERLSADQPGFLSEIFSFDGCVLELGCTLPLLRWLAENEPSALARARHVLCSKDWLCFKLTGAFQMDPTEASVLPGNTRTQTYDDRLFEMFGISRFKHLFPPIVPSESVVGGILPESAALTGLLAGTPVVAGAGDVPSNAIGIGAIEAGVAFTVLGTNCQSCLVFDQPMMEPADVGLLFYVPGQRWFRALMNVAGTANLDWFIDQFCPAERDAAPSREALFAQLEQMAGQSEMGSRGVVYHPYLSSAGVIAPFIEPAARGQFFGLMREHRRADLLRSVYEGTALSIRDCYAALNRAITEIRFAGGGARSGLWGQMIADCMGARVVVPMGTEFGAKGAALLAGVGIGVFESVAQASTTTLSIARVYDPDATRRSRYDAMYEVYGMLRDAVRPAWRRSAEIMSHYQSLPC
jgi:sugar (pentulose or hexulose) kinase